MWVLAAACGGDDDEVPPDANAGASTSPGAQTDAGALASPAYDRSEIPWKIVVSMPIFADFVREIGGDQVSVTTLIPPGEDPHTYVPSPDLKDEVLEADIVFVNGLGLDQPAVSFVETHRPDRAQYVIDFVRNVPSPSTAQPVDRPIYAKEAGDDPHLFLDPVLVPVYVETVAHTLTIIDGTNETYYDSRYQAYRELIRAMDSATAEKLASIPPGDKELVVLTHDSLVHYANRYGLTVAATIADDGEDGVRELLGQRPPPAVFAEAGLDNSALERAAEDAGVDICTVATDAVGGDDRPYLEVMERLADELSRCLGG